MLDRDILHYLPKGIWNFEQELIVTCSESSSLDGHSQLISLYAASKWWLFVLHSQSAVLSGWSRRAQMRARSLSVSARRQQLYSRKAIQQKELWLSLQDRSMQNTSTTIAIRSRKGTSSLFLLPNSNVSRLSVPPYHSLPTLRGLKPVATVNRSAPSGITFMPVFDSQLLEVSLQSPQPSAP